MVRAMAEKEKTGGLGGGHVDTCSRDPNTVSEGDWRLIQTDYVGLEGPSTF